VLRKMPSGTHIFLNDDPPHTSRKSKSGAGEKKRIEMTNEEY
jgi:hypothetical protein